MRKQVAEFDVVGARNQQHRAVAERCASRLRQPPQRQLRRAPMLVVERVVEHRDLRIIAGKTEFGADLEIAGKQSGVGWHGREFPSHRGIQFVPAGEIGGMEILRGRLRTQ